VRLIDENGDQAGVVSLAEALSRAEAADLDLVEIAPNASPPVVKILDWGKYRYEQTKQQQKARKRSAASEVKTVRLGLKIGEHDLQVKTKRSRGFIETGHKVKVALRFRGREITHPDLGRAVLMRFMSHLEDIAQIEQQPSLSGREMSMLITASKEKKEKPESNDAQDENS
jgi:translation initiation factor IF-3